MRHLALALLACCLCAAEPPAAVNVKDTPWCTVTTPKEVKRGEKATAQVVIKAGALSADSTLRIDVHKYVGKERKPGAGRAAPVSLAAGAAHEGSFSFAPPEDASAITFVVYVLPAGTDDWKSKTHATEAGVKVVD